MHPIRHRIRSLALLALVATIAGAQATTASSPQTSERWAWLGTDGGTYWYVPTAWLPAYRWQTSNPAAASEIDDQTVWHIERFDDGYVFGPVAAQLGDGAPQCQYLIGSITPDGQVHLTFTSSGTATPTLTTGTGSMIDTGRGWAFQMQMASGSDQLQVAHWARMMQCRRGESCWNDLPGLDTTSIPEFIGPCDPD